MPLLRRPVWGSRLVWRCVGTGGQTAPRVEQKRAGLPATLHDMQSLPVAEPVTVLGWVKSVRRHKSVAFLAVNDGSVERDVQLVVTDPALLKKCVWIGAIPVRSSGCSNRTAFIVCTWEFPSRRQEASGKVQAGGSRGRWPSHHSRPLAIARPKYGLVPPHICSCTSSYSSDL